MAIHDAIYSLKRLSSLRGRWASRILLGFASFGTGLVLANGLLPGKTTHAVPASNPTDVVLEMPQLLGAWCTKATFLSGWAGTDWGIWGFHPDSTVMMGSSLGTHGYGTWSQNSDGSFSFSAIEQFFDKQVWAMNIYIYAPQVIIRDDGNAFSTPNDKPVQGTMRDPAGNFIGVSTIELLGTRIQLGAATTLPRQGES